MGILFDERLSAWGARVNFAGVLLVFSELVVWQTPGTFSALEWLGLAAVYLALAAVMLDLLARYHVNDVFSLFLAAGIYGLLNGTLISHIAPRDLPLSLIVRPLAAQPLAFMAALAAARFLASGRGVRLLELVAGLGIGLAWGIWVRWFPVVSDDPVPAVAANSALAVLAVTLIALLVLRYLVSSADAVPADRWLLGPVEWALAGGVLVAALLVALERDALPTAGLPVVIGLVAFFGVVLSVTSALRPDRSLLARAPSPHTPNPAAWLALVVAFLVAGWAGLRLPGSGDSSVQSDLLFGALTGFGIVWPPAVSSLIGVKTFIQLTRRGM